MDENIKNLIEWWKLKGQRETDPFIKFFFFYVCFDAWITSASGKDTDKEKIRWLVDSDNCLKEQRMGFWNASRAQSLLKNLRNLSPVEDMRPGHRGKLTELKDINDLEEVVLFIYQIRCNLFHGSKDPMNSRDANLVEMAGELLEKWIVWADHKCQ